MQQRKGWMQKMLRDVEVESTDRGVSAGAGVAKRGDSGMTGELGWKNSEERISQLNHYTRRER